MTADVVVAQGLVWLAAHGVLVMGVGFLLLSVALFFWSPRLRLVQENRDLRSALDKALVEALREKHNATVALRFATARMEREFEEVDPR